VTTIKYRPQCGNAFRTKGHFQSTLRSVYGTVGTRIRRLSGAATIITHI
jgi:hypothetical protein